MKSVIVTGATSYIAVALIKRLLNARYKIYAIVRTHSSNIEKVPINPNVEIIELDMEDICHLSEYKIANVEALYHFAWDGVRGEDRNNQSLQERNYSASVKCIEIAVKMQIPYFIGIGSQAEYAISNEIITEESPLIASTEYGKQKIAVYEYGMKICKKKPDFSFLWARIFSTYGEGENSNTLVMQCIKKMQKDETIVLSPCEHLWDYTYVDDVAEALFLMLKKRIASGAYNISNGHAKPLKEFVKDIKRVTVSGSELAFGAIPYGNGVPLQMNPDVSKIKRATGWSALTIFDDGIKKIIEDTSR